MILSSMHVQSELSCALHQIGFNGLNQVNHRGHPFRKPSGSASTRKTGNLGTWSTGIRFLVLTLVDILCACASTHVHKKKAASIVPKEVVCLHQ